MSFSSRRRNYLLRPHRTDGLIDWMKGMLMHSFVLDALDTTGADTFSHFEELIEEHRENIKINESTDSNNNNCNNNNSRLKQLVPTIGTFHTRLPLRAAFEAYNDKHKLTKRKHIYISFNEIRHIMNLAQIMAMRKSFIDASAGGDTTNLLNSTTTTNNNPQSLTSSSLKEELNRLASNDLELLNSKHANEATLSSIESNPNSTNYKFDGPQMITFDGDQTLYSDGANFEQNQELALYLYLLLKHGVIVAVVTAAGYEYNVEKYTLRLSGLLSFFRDKGLTTDECDRFYLFGGECNYLLKLGTNYELQPVKELGPGGWMTATTFLGQDGPGNWKENDVQDLLNLSEESMNLSLSDQNLRARVIRKKRAVGLIPLPGYFIPREALDEAVLRVQHVLSQDNLGGASASICKDIPYCAFNGGKDVWVDIGNKRVGVQVLSSYLGIPSCETLHIGDQFLNTGNDFAARDVCPCIWITSPEETTYILKSILRLARVSIDKESYITTAKNDNDSAAATSGNDDSDGAAAADGGERRSVNFSEAQRRSKIIMDVYTGEILKKAHTKQ